MGSLNMSSGRVKFCFKEGSVSFSETESKQKCSDSEILRITFIFYIILYFFLLVFFSREKLTRLVSSSFVRIFLNSSF